MGDLKTCNKAELLAHATFISPELLFSDALPLPTPPFRLIMEIDQQIVLWASKGSISELSTISVLFQQRDGSVCSSKESQLV